MESVRLLYTSVNYTSDCAIFISYLVSEQLFETGPINQHNKKNIAYHIS